VNLEKAIAAYLEARKRDGLPAGVLHKERVLLNRYLGFCNQRDLGQRERCLVKAVVMYRDWLKEQPYSPEQQKQHLLVLYRLADFVSETPEREEMT